MTSATVPGKVAQQISTRMISFLREPRDFGVAQIDWQN
jgi:hypothetical protein